MTSIGKVSRERCNALLPTPRPAAYARADVLQENEFSARLQYAPDLAQRTFDIVNRAENKRTHDSVRTIVGVIKMVGKSFAQFRIEARGSCCTLEIGMHVRIRLDSDPAQPARVVRQIRAGARTDLDDGSAQAAEKFAPSICNQTLVASRAVRHQPGEETLPQAKVVMRRAIHR